MYVGKQYNLKNNDKYQFFMEICYQNIIRKNKQIVYIFKF